MSKSTTTTKQPKTVLLSTYLQTIAITALTAGVIGFVASYFVTVNIHSYARHSVKADMQLVLKDQQ